LTQGLAISKPCPFVTCKYHLLLEDNYILNRLKKWERFIKYKGKYVWMNVPITDEEIILRLEELPPRKTCTLEMASYGPVTLQEISEMYGVTRERVRQIAHNERADSGAIAKLKKSWKTKRLLGDFK
jgi:hypothetical protein